MPALVTCPIRSLGPEEGPQGSRVRLLLLEKQNEPLMMNHSQGTTRMQLVNKYCQAVGYFLDKLHFIMKTKSKNIIKTIVPYSINSL